MCTFLYLIWNPIMLCNSLCSYFNCSYLSLSWHSFLYHLLYEVVLYMISIYVCIYMYICHFFVCIFYSVTGHHGRTVWLNGPPCINMFEKKNIFATEKRFILKGNYISTICKHNCHKSWPSMSCSKPNDAGGSLLNGLNAFNHNIRSFKVFSGSSSN